MYRLRNVQVEECTGVFIAILGYRLLTIDPILTAIAPTYYLASDASRLFWPPWSSLCDGRFRVSLAHPVKFIASVIENNVSKNSLDGRTSGNFRFAFSHLLKLNRCDSDFSDYTNYQGHGLL
jgi:divalent metal cation (Fe/Co/Zn/Cd) transporter